jgi:hypothetical protein
MSCNSLLELLAQLSVTVAGFSGIAGAFRSGSQSWSSWDSINIRLMLLLSLVACGLSLVPLFLGSCDRGRLIAGIVFGLSWLGVSVYWWREVKKVYERPRGPWQLIPLIVIVHLSALLLGLASICVGPVLYALGVALLLGLSAAFFVAFTAFFRPANEPHIAEVVGKDEKR